MNGIENIGSNFLLGLNSPLQQQSRQLVQQNFLNSLQAQNAATTPAPSSMANFYPKPVSEAGKVSPLSEAFKFIHQQDELIRSLGDKPITSKSANPEIREMTATLNNLFEVQKKLTHFTINTSAAFAVKDGIVTASQRLTQA
jgi:hypothetical protein